MDPPKSNAEKHREILRYIEASIEWGFGFPSIRTLMNWTGRSRTSVVTTLETLTIRGRLERVEQPPGSLRKCVYQLPQPRRKRMK